MDITPSSNGRGSEAWCRSWTHFSVGRRSPGSCRVTFDHPPINAITATTVAELAERRSGRDARVARPPRAPLP